MIQVISSRYRVSIQASLECLATREELTSHFSVCDTVGENLRQVEEDSTALVEDLDPGLDLEVFSDRLVQRIEHGLRVPEEVGGVQHI